MNHADAIKLMQFLHSCNFTDRFIVLTLVNCESGMGIGHAMIRATEAIEGENE
jgi:hypothetical protein